MIVVVSLDELKIDDIVPVYMTDPEGNLIEPPAMGKIISTATIGEYIIDNGGEGKFALRANKSKKYFYWVGVD